MKQVLTLAAALVAGFFGGLLGTQVAYIREQARPEAIVRARSFELVDEAGQAISYWGVDKGQNLVLAFGSHLARAAAWRTRPSGPPPRCARRSRKPTCRDRSGR